MQEAPDRTVTVEAGLSFLGVGVPPPQASWGTLLNDGYVNLGRSLWGVVFPAGMLAVATLGFTLLGEAVRDISNSKQADAPRLQHK